jgi:serine phosphatase RsbU (regulator of sigma subunit)
VRSRRPLVVPDLDKPGGLDGVAQSDEHRRFMLDAGYRSAVVLPMIARRRLVGILSLLHVRADRRYDKDDIALLEDVASRAALAYDNARLYAERSRLARTLQRSLLPAALPAPPSLKLAARYHAATTDPEVGGDFYDVFETDDGWIAVLGDVCGKGPQAAALTALTRYTARAAALQSSEPRRIFEQINAAMLHHDSEHRFATAVLVRIETHPSRSRVTCATAGHPAAVLLRANGAMEALGGPSHPLGVVPDPAFHQSQAELRPYDTLLLYTDGLIDIGSPDHKLKHEQLARVLATCAGLTPGALLDEVEQCVVERRIRQRDDIALLALQQA